MTIILTPGPQGKSIRKGVDGEPLSFSPLHAGEKLDLEEFIRSRYFLTPARRGNPAQQIGDFFDAHPHPWPAGENLF